MHYLVRVLDVVVGHLADVDESVLMHADVDKRPKAVMLVTMPFKVMPVRKSLT